MRLIDADALKEAIVDYPYGFRGMIYEDINAQPTIEPKRGRWEDVEEVLYEGNTEGTPYTVTAVGYKCSVCGTEMGNLWSFCPNCGAKMDEVEE